MSANACLDGTGLRADELGERDVALDARLELRVVKNMLEALGDDPVLGLEAGSRAHFTAFGTLGLAIVSSPTVRRAYELGVRYLNLSATPLSLALEEDGNELRLVIDDAGVPPAVRSFFVARAAATIVNLHHEALGVRVPPRRVTFTMPKPRSAEAFARVLGTVPLFGERRNVLAVDGTMLDQTLPCADELTARAAEEACRKLLGALQGRASLAGRVRELLLRDPASAGDMEATASVLAMTSRTLRRRLLDEGTTYRALVDEVRAKLAEELLNEHVSVATIAERLGYADASSFVHAFKRWNGVPPRASRSTNAGGAKARSRRR
jgi:AraC-like DNA-binding protein